MGDIGGRVGDIEREREWERGWLSEGGFWSVESEREGILGCFYRGSMASLGLLSRGCLEVLVCEEIYNGDSALGMCCI